MSVRGVRSFVHCCFVSATAAAWTKFSPYARSIKLFSFLDLPFIYELGCVVAMPRTLSPLGSTTNDRGEGPTEPFLANQINLGSLFRMRFFRCPYGRPGSRIFQQDILFSHQKHLFVWLVPQFWDNYLYIHNHWDICKIINIYIYYINSNVFQL